MATPKAPPGGFQQGGWYEGRQYWNGTFSDPGQINSQSNQVGAGQLVSSEVNKQSDAAQGLKAGTIDAYLASQRAKPGTTGSSGNTSGSYTGPVTTGAVTGGNGAPIVSTQPSINLNQIYDNLLSGSGVSQKEEELNQMSRQFTEAKGKVNDNPFLSEATRVGREAKLIKLFDERTGNIRNEIAQKKADIQMKYDMQLKQFDINSEQAKTAQDQFNKLLELGALDGASGEDIANITRSTGLSSSVIQSAINNKKLANIKTETQTYDDGVNEGFLIFSIDPFGNVVNEQRIVSGPSSRKQQAAKFSVGSFSSGYGSGSESSSIITNNWE